MIITPKTEKKEDSVAYHIATPYISKKAEILPLVFQMVTDMEVVSKQWEENRIIIEEKKDLEYNIIEVILAFL